MSGLFQDQSLDYKLNVLVVRTVIFEKNEVRVVLMVALIAAFSLKVTTNGIVL